MAFAQGKLGKLLFIFYPKAAAPGIGIPFIPQFNPTNFKVSHNVNYDCAKKTTTANTDNKFVSTGPRTVTMDLMFDGTGASPTGLASLAQAVGVSVPHINTVDLQVAIFLKLAYKINGENHKPFYIMMVWGTFIMTCQLTTANVSYDLFSRDGRPLRAKISITLQEFIDRTLLGKLLSLFSPDLSKSITVKEGDTLPLLCEKEYGDPSLYLQVAEVNKLNNYRKLTPGTELLFPPIKNIV